MTKPDDSAFPIRLNPKDPNSEIGGFTKREWLIGMIASHSHTIWTADTKESELQRWAEAVLDHADALIQALNKPPEAR